jgi:hypothetical protein
VERDIADADSGISLDWRFGILYNAALKLCTCTILLYAEGYRPAQNLHHYRSIYSIQFILGPGKKADADNLDECRKKRNVVEYRYVGSASQADVEELMAFVKEFQEEVRDWLKKNHPDLL